MTRFQSKRVKKKVLLEEPVTFTEKLIFSIPARLQPIIEIIIFNIIFR